MASTIGSSNLKSVKKSEASGFVTLRGYVAEPVTGEPVMTPLGKADALTYAVIVDSRGEARANRIKGDLEAAEHAARVAASKHVNGTVYLAKKVGTGETGEIFQIVETYAR